MQRKIAAFSSAVEFATGLVLVLDPALVAYWLLGQQISDVAMVLGRCLGVALLALGVACWPQGLHITSGGQPLRGLLLYNALTALYLGYVGAILRMGGVLIWPAVLLHAAVALSLIWTGRANRHKSVASTH